MHVDLVSDRSLVIRAAVHDVQFTMMLTIGLVILVIFIFLRTLWATVIPSVAVPLSLLATFAVMYARRLQPRQHLADGADDLGRVRRRRRDRHDREHRALYRSRATGPFEAALKGAGQIGFTIISITFSLIAVFIPLLFMGGIIGRLFREFAVTVSVAVVASAFISLTLTPVMCSLFLKEHSEQPPGRLSRGGRARFPGGAARLRPGAAIRLPPPVRDAGGDAGADGRDRLSLHDDPQGVFPAAGYRLHLRPGRGAPGHLLREDGRA